MKVKVCGITTVNQLKELEMMDVDFAGLIFHKPSPRYVLNEIKSPYSIKNENINIKKVGVFVNESINTVIDTAKEWELDMVQLHGDETPEFCKEIKSVVKTTKAFRIGDSSSFANINAYSDVVDCFLFDTLGERYGGTGKQFDWNLLTSTEINKPFFLSGGIGSDDVDKIDEICNRTTSLFALDLNSKFEITPGIKDMDKLSVFLSSIYKK
jgi:phosphoribosylanthranilate isomerase